MEGIDVKRGLDRTHSRCQVCGEPDKVLLCPSACTRTLALAMKYAGIRRALQQGHHMEAGKAAQRLEADVRQYERGVAVSRERNTVHRDE
jgi:hypothetical protein